MIGDGKPFARTSQYIAGLDLGYELSHSLTLSSTTGFYQTRVVALDIPNQADATFPFNPALGPAALGGITLAYADLRLREISEEMRLTSSFEGPFNFMLGGFFQDQKLSEIAASSYNALNPIALYPPVTVKQNGTSYSLFGSLSVKPIDTVEISGGARYSHERKEIGFFRLLSGAIGAVPYVAGQQVPTDISLKRFHNVSPEATISWRPTSRLTIYGGWKRGFLSGGFNPAGTGTGVLLIPNRSYLEEVVEGFEGGFKGILLNGKLRLNLAAYRYDIKGLQVTVNLPNPNRQIVSNAASARSSGIEADFNFDTPVSGLSFRGAIAYNKAKYLSYIASPCYGGQTISLGCNGGFDNTLNRFTTQDLGGRPLVRAPEWGGSIGATYEVRDDRGNVFGISADGNYTSKFFTDTVNNPLGLQKGYWLLDASARYEMANGLSLSLIGRNLTQTYYFQRSSAAPLTGGPSGVASSFAGDQVASVSRGREIIVRVSFRF